MAAEVFPSEEYAFPLPEVSPIIFGGSTEGTPLKDLPPLRPSSSPAPIFLAQALFLSPQSHFFPLQGGFKGCYAVIGCDAGSHSFRFLHLQQPGGDSFLFLSSFFAARVLPSFQERRRFCGACSFVLLRRFFTRDARFFPFLNQA